MPLVTTLRDGIKIIPKSKDTASQPPNFYDKDIQNYSSKFDLAVKGRAEFKRKYLSHKNMSILSTNDNADFDLDERHKNSTGG